MVAKRLRRQPLTPRQEARRGRPRVHSEGWSKVSVVLFDRQIVRLDHLINDIRRRTGTVMSRAALIRAVIDGLFDGGFEIKTVSSEGELRDHIARHVRL
jgi:hypothetical protein